MFCQTCQIENKTSIRYRMFYPISYRAKLFWKSNDMGERREQMNQTKPKENGETKPRRPSTQLSPDDWVRAATNVLAKSGIDAVRVEPLAIKLGVTKGSFYHHFQGRPSLYDAMLDDWRRRATKRIIERLNDKKLSTKEKLSDLFDLPMQGARSRRGANLELAIRLWAKRDSKAQRIVDEVDEQRISFIHGLYLEMGLKDERASARAFLFYSSMMGQALFQVSTVEKDHGAIVERLLRD